MEHLNEFICFAVRFFILTMQKQQIRNKKRKKNIHMVNMTQIKEENLRQSQSKIRHRRSLAAT